MAHLVLLPGLDGSGELFAELLRRTPDGVATTVIPYPPTTPLDYPGCVDHVGRRLPTDRPFVLLGESFSGPVAITLAAGHPPGLAGLVLVNTFAVRPLWSWLRFLPWRLAFSLPITTSKVGLHLVDRADARRWVVPVRQACAGVSATVLARRLRAVLTVDVRRELARVRVPILDLRGDRDRLIGPTGRHRILAVRDDVEAATVAGPHLLLQTRPSECWDRIEPFLHRCR